MIKTRNYPFSIDADRIIKPEKGTEKDFSENENEISSNEKISKINKGKLLLNERRAMNFLKEEKRGKN